MGSQASNVDASNQACGCVHENVPDIRSKRKAGPLGKKGLIGERAVKVYQVIERKGNKKGSEPLSVAESNS